MVVRIILVGIMSVIIFFVAPYFFYEYGLFVEIGNSYPVLYNELIFLVTSLIFYLILFKELEINFGNNKIALKWYIIIFLLQIVNLLPQIIVIYSDGYLPEYLFKLSYLMLFLNLVLIPSLVEEFIFRGIFYGYISRGLNRTYSVFGWNLSIATLVTAIIFAGFHTTFFLNSNEFLGAVKIFIFTFCLGLICGYMRQRNGGILSSITLHLFYNFLAIFIPKILISLNPYH